jgi:CubicO group peptidase (beta-lactamase class C family)
MFGIGSISKSFTSALLGFLVDEKRLSWDDRVVDRLPGFRLSDSGTTKEVRIRDLLSHRTGVPGENLLFWGSDLSRDEVIRRARFIPVRWPLRTHYEYQNIMFLAAGQIVPAVTGRSWDDQLVRRIFVPLGMTRSEPGVRSLTSRSDVASPHAPVGRKLEPIKWLDLDNAAPAGSIVSTALDMARYVRWHLGNGRFGTRRLMADSTMREMHSGQMDIPKEGMYAALYPDAARIRYGLGWITHEYHGHRVVEHGGQTDGMHATVSMVPDEGLGIVVLTNSVLFGLPSAIAYRALDLAFGRPPRDWSTEIKRALGGGDIDATAGPTPPASPAEATIPAAQLVGRYRHRAYGDAVIAAGADGPTLTLLGRTVPLRHWTGDTYRPEWRPDDALIRGSLPLGSFARGKQGSVATLRFDRISFERVADQ